MNIFLYCRMSFLQKSNVKVIKCIHENKIRIFTFTNTIINSTINLAKNF